MMILSSDSSPEYNDMSFGSSPTSDDDVDNKRFSSSSTNDDNDDNAVEFRFKTCIRSYW